MMINDIIIGIDIDLIAICKVIASFYEREKNKSHEEIAFLPIANRSA